jgi:hypothetical protein
MATTDNHRSVSKRRIVPLFNGSVEGVAIQMGNR